MAFAIKNVLKTEYKGNHKIYYIKTRKEKLCCSESGNRKIIRSGFQYRDIRCVLVGHKETILRMKVLRIECKKCGCIRQERIPFVTGKRSYTNKFACYLVSLSRIGAYVFNKFCKKASKAKARIKAVATDHSAAFISSVRGNAPKATLVFDHFHVAKLMNDTLD